MCSLPKQLKPGQVREESINPMSFIKHQEERLAVRYLIWRYQRAKIPVPSESELEHRAKEIVEEAHHIARKRGRNVFGIIKELIEDVKKEKNG